MAAELVVEDEDDTTVEVVVPDDTEVTELEVVVLEETPL